jgi:hypothetical protein
MGPTKSDNSRQPTFRPLSVEQLTAIDVLVMGKTDAEAAAAAGVTRPTVTDWRNHHPVFRATLNARRSALWAEAHDRLRALVGKAIETLEGAVQEGKLSVSIDVLKIVGLHGAVGAHGALAPRGPSSAVGVARGLSQAAEPARCQSARVLQPRLRPGYRAQKSHLQGSLCRQRVDRHTRDPCHAQGLRQSYA